MIRFFSLMQKYSPLQQRRVRIWSLCVLAIVAFLMIDMVFNLNLTPDMGISSSQNTMWIVEVFLCLFLASLVFEYIDASLGMGYGTTLTPILLLIFHDKSIFVPAILISGWLAGLLAAALHHRDGNVDFKNNPEAKKTALILVSLSGIGVAVAVSLTIYLDYLDYQERQETNNAVVALAAPALGGAELPANQQKPENELQNTGKRITSLIIFGIILVSGMMTLLTAKKPLPYRPSTLIGIGTLAAFNKAFSGGGYGPLVTSGQIVSGINAKSAVAITSLAESFTCLVAIIGYIISSIYFETNVNWLFAIPMGLGAALSVPMATLTIKSLPEKYVKRIIGLVTCLLALWLGWKTFFPTYTLF